MYEDDVNLNWFLFWQYLYNLVFSDQKIKFQKFCSCGFLCPLTVNRILRFSNLTIIVAQNCLKILRGVWVFEIFEERGGSGGRGQIFPIKREFGKIGGGGGWGVVLKKGVSLIFILTNPFWCYISECLVRLYVIYVCCLFTPFLSVLFMFPKKNLVL